MSGAGTGRANPPCPPLCRRRPAAARQQQQQQEEKETKPPPRWKSRRDPHVRTVLGDPIHWDVLRLPLRGCPRTDPTQLWRCRKHKRLEASHLLTLPPGSSFVDCGSHFGDTVLTMAVHARANGRADLRFFAFEPSRRKCRFIWDMVRANGLEETVKVLNCCVGDDGCSTAARIPEGAFERYDGRVAYRPCGAPSPAEDGSGGDGDGAEKARSVSPRRCYFDGSSGGSDCESSSSSSSSEEDGSSDEEDEERGGRRAGSGRRPVPVVSLDSLKDEIQPLGFLHLDVEGWEARALRGAAEMLRDARGTTCYVVSEVWGEKDCRRRREACLELVESSPDEDVQDAMRDHPHFERLEDIVDGDRNLFYRCRPCS